MNLRDFFTETEKPAGHGAYRPTKSGSPPTLVSPGLTADSARNVSGTQGSKSSMSFDPSGHAFVQ